MTYALKQRLLALFALLLGVLGAVLAAVVVLLVSSGGDKDSPTSPVLTKQSSPTSEKLTPTPTPEPPTLPFSSREVIELVKEWPLLESFEGARTVLAAVNTLRRASMCDAADDRLDWVADLAAPGRWEVRAVMRCSSVDFDPSFLEWVFIEEGRRLLTSSDAASAYPLR